MIVGLHFGAFDKMAYGKMAKVVLGATIIAVIIVALGTVAFVMHQTASNQSPAVDYWIINIRALGDGYVTPNGTIHVPTNQTGINVTATATGWGSFIFWRLDGESLANQSQTITVQRQQANSSHLLEASFSVSRPPIEVIVYGIISVNASSYKVYNFTIPSPRGSTQSRVDGSFGASGGNNNIKVFIMDRANFAKWENGQNATTYYDSGERANGYFEIFLKAGGTYFLVYDNTADTTSQKNVQTTVGYMCLLE